MKLSYLLKEFKSVVLLWILLSANISRGTNEESSNSVGLVERESPRVNAEKSFRYDHNGPDPYKGLSERALWGQKPKTNLKPHEAPTDEEADKIKKWTRALSEIGANPFNGQSVRQLNKTKPRMKKIDHWPPENEEEWRMWQWWHAMRKADPDSEWKIPIDFFGIVVNQSNQPISGVSVSIVPSMVDGTTPKISAVTDASGQFSVNNITGKCIDVVVGKVGYCPFVSAHQNFEYFDIGNGGFHIPDPSNRIVFRLWEYSNPEPMFLSDVMPRHIPIDDKVVWLDEKGRIANTGHIGVSVLRVSSTNLTDGFVISIHSAEGAGVQLASPDDELMFEAPASGYQSIIRIEQAAGKDCWVAKKIRLFLQTTDEKYAALQFNVSQYNDGSAGIRGVIYFNPSGSRNLQYRDDLRLRKAAKENH